MHLRPRDPRPRDPRARSRAALRCRSERMSNAALIGRQRTRDRLARRSKFRALLSGGSTGGSECLGRTLAMDLELRMGDGHGDDRR